MKSTASSDVRAATVIVHSFGEPIVFKIGYRQDCLGGHGTSSNALGCSRSPSPAPAGGRPGTLETSVLTGSALGKYSLVIPG